MVAKRDFTDRFLRSIKPIKPATKGKDGKVEEEERPLKPGERVIHWDAVVPGFGLRVSDKSCADNKGAFVLVTRFPGSDRRRSDRNLPPCVSQRISRIGNFRPQL